MEAHSLDGIAVAIVPLRRWAVLHTIMPIADVLEEMHLGGSSIRIGGNKDQMIKTSNATMKRQTDKRVVLYAA